MFALIPLLCFLFLWACFYARPQKGEPCEGSHPSTLRPQDRKGKPSQGLLGSGSRCWRSSFLAASVVCGLLVVAGTELLSLSRWLTFDGVLAFWCAAAAASGLFLRSRLRRGQSLGSFRLPKLDWFSAAMVAVIVLIGAVTLMIVLVAPPNTWDSMTYHMSRVMHWEQNRSVAFYPTHIMRQLHLNPGAEYAILHLQLLWGGDRLANLVQWLCMAGSLVGVSLIAKKLGADLRGQVFAALVCATMPMGILQASSTQNDYVVTFWLVCFISCGVSLVREERPTWTMWAGAGVGLGLAILTKATACLIAFPFVIWIIFARLRQSRWRAVPKLLLMAALCIAVNLGFWARNYRMYGSPIGPTREGRLGEAGYINEAFGVRALASNVLRNIALHLATPYRPLDPFTTRTIEKLHKAIGADINDPRTTWPGEEFHIPRLRNHETSAANPAHLVLIVAALVLIFASPRLRRTPGLVAYVCAVAATFLLFCLCLKWQLWHARLHLPLFVISTPFVAFGFLRGRGVKLGTAIALILAIAAFPPLFKNATRPILSRWTIFSATRMQLYFVNRPTLTAPYLEACRILRERHCAKVGLILDEDEWEYPLWVILKSANEEVHLEHVCVENASARLARFHPPGPGGRGQAFDSGEPDAIVRIKATVPEQPEKIVLKGAVYSPVWSYGRMSVLLK